MRWTQISRAIVSQLQSKIFSLHWILWRKLRLQLLSRSFCHYHRMESRLQTIYFEMALATWSANAGLISYKKLVLLFWNYYQRHINKKNVLVMFEILVLFNVLPRIALCKFNYNFAWFRTKKYMHMWCVRLSFWLKVANVSTHLQM